jgi:uncharacterized membrane protein HdeD (DUF308 family)
VSLLRVWFIASAALLVGLLIYAYAPILIPLLAVTIGLGLVTAGIVRLARRFDRRRDNDQA